MQEVGWRKIEEGVAEEEGKIGARMVRMKKICVECGVLKAPPPREGCQHIPGQAAWIDLVPE